MCASVFRILSRIGIYIYGRRYFTLVLKGCALRRSRKSADFRPVDSEHGFKHLSHPRVVFTARRPLARIAWWQVHTTSSLTQCVILLSYINVNIIQLRRAN